MTGGQSFAPEVDFSALALGAGVKKVERIEELSDFETALPRLLSEPGPHFVILPVVNSEPLPSVRHTDHTSRVTNLREALGLAPANKKGG
jgi:thiamine pyrophosphate-dependent acetolactate synthase large subunit-like protein